MPGRIAGGGTEPRLPAFLRPIAESLYGSAATVSSLAAACGMSVSSFRARVRAATGCSPKQFVEHARLRKAESLLKNSSLSIKQVMAASGMADPSHFSRRFRKMYGSSPSEYRAAVASKKQSIRHPREDFCSFCPLFEQMAHRLAKRPTKSARQKRIRSR